MQTDNLELKKLVYLYLMNYAKSQPDMAIMAVNTFVKVSFSVVCINFMELTLCYILLPRIDSGAVMHPDLLISALYKLFACLLNLTT